MQGLEFTFEASKSVEGLEITEKKEVYIPFSDSDTKEEIEKEIEKVLMVLTSHNLPKRFMLDVNVLKDNYDRETIVRVIGNWETIEHRIAEGFSLNVKEQQERTGHWKKKIRQFVGRELEPIIERRIEKQADTAHF